MLTPHQHIQLAVAFVVALSVFALAAATEAYVPPESTSIDLRLAGKPSKNLQLSLALSKAKYYAGDPIAVTLTVKNLGPEVWLQRSTEDVDYSFTFFNQNDEELPIRHLDLPSAGRASAGEELASSATLTDKFDLDDYYSLVKPGMFKVVASSPIYLKDQNSVYTTLISNPVTFRIVLR